MLNIKEVGDAVRRALIPTVHGVYRFAQLGRVPLVDAACIEPDPFDAVLQCQSTEVLDLVV